MRAFTQLQAGDSHELKSRGAASRLAQQQMALPKHTTFTRALRGQLHNYDSAFAIERLVSGRLKTNAEWLLVNDTGKDIIIEISPSLGGDHRLAERGESLMRGDFELNARGDFKGDPLVASANECLTIISSSSLQFMVK